MTVPTQRYPKHHRKSESKTRFLIIRLEDGTRATINLSRGTLEIQLHDEWKYRRPATPTRDILSARV